MPELTGLAGLTREGVHLIGAVVAGGKLPLGVEAHSAELQAADARGGRGQPREAAEVAMWARAARLPTVGFHVRRVLDALLLLRPLRTLVLVVGARGAGAVATHLIRRHVGRLPLPEQAACGEVGAVDVALGDG